MTPEGRIEATFAKCKAEGRTAFVGYVTTGYPTLESTLEIVPALVSGGADLVELSIPFSDPLADGPTIQRSTFAALQNGVTPQYCLEVVRKLREQGVEVPIVFMTYYNLILSYGSEQFCRDSADAGVDGFIVVDLPAEESSDFRQECEKHNLRTVYLLAPTSSPERIKHVAELGSGFIYCVSLTGTTGAREELADGLREFVERVRSYTDLPIAVGFGISQRKHFQSVGRVADAAVIGSAIIDTIDGGDPSTAAARVKEYAEVVTGRRE
jgi:tryptophan synthase alpha subunit